MREIRMSGSVGTPSGLPLEVTRPCALRRPTNLRGARERDPDRTSGGVPRRARPTRIGARCRRRAGIRPNPVLLYRGLRYAAATASSPDVTGPNFGAANRRWCFDYRLGPRACGRRKSARVSGGAGVRQRARVGPGPAAAAGCARTLPELSHQSRPTAQQQHNS